MNDKDKVLDITLRMIALISLENPSNLLLAVRTHYDLWQSELIVLLKERNLPVHKYLSQLLQECGYEKATEGKVRTYMSLVSQSKKTLSVQQSNAVSVITNQVGMVDKKVRSGVSAPVSSAVVSSQGVRQSNGSMVVSKPVSVVPVNSVVPGAVFSFRTALTRLRNEENGTPWNESDDELHLAFLDLCQERGASSIKELRLYIKESEQSKKDCLVQYMAKIDITRKVF